MVKLGKIVVFTLDITDDAKNKILLGCHQTGFREVNLSQWLDNIVLLIVSRNHNLFNTALHCKMFSAWS